MPNGPPEMSRDSNARDTLEVSENELKRASQLPLDPSPHTPPPLPPQAPETRFGHEGPEDASRVTAPPSFAPTSAAAGRDSGDAERLAPAFRVTLALAGALLFAVPFFLGSAKPPAVSTARRSVSSVSAAATTTAATARTPSPVGENSDLACTEATALETEQLIELDSVRVSGLASVSSGATAPRKAGSARDVPRRRFFDPSAAQSAIRAVTGNLRVCGPDARGKVDVAVTFAPSGSATVATVEEDRLRATPTGSCVAQHLRDARIGGFDGTGETVRATLLVD
ncbi:MAG TPA: hypothetical protein VF395_12655 [Polyangiaceae bacterium]